MASESITNRDGSRVVLVDNGDGTGVRTTYAPDGAVVGVENLLDLPIDPPAVDPDPPEVVAAQVIAAEIDTRLAPSSVNSIAEVKAAIRDGLAAAVAQLRGEP